MNITSQTRVFAIVALAACSVPCSAGPWGRAIREGVEAVGKRSGQAVRKGAQEAAERAASRKALREGLETVGKRSGALVVRVSDDVAKPVISRFGDDGARALNSLSTTGAQRLAAMSDDLAASGRGKDWMKLIAQRGDEVMDWLWKRKGSVVVGTIATAVVLKPEEFIQASEHVATSAINAAGKHVLEPLIAGGTQHIAGPIAQHAAAAFPWRLIFVIVILFAIASVAKLWQVASARRQLRVYSVDGLNRIDTAGVPGDQPVK